MLTFRLEYLGKELLRRNSLWVASFFASDSNFAQPDFCFFYQKVFFWHIQTSDVIFWSYMCIMDF